MTILDIHNGEYLRPSGLQFETVLSTGDGERNAPSRSGRFRQQMGAKRRKKRGIKQKAVLSKIMERTAQNRVIFKAGTKKEKSRNPHGYWIFRWRSGWDSNPRALSDNSISSQVVKTEPGGIWRKITANVRTPKMPCLQGFPHPFASKTQ